MDLKLIVKKQLQINANFELIRALHGVDNKVFIIKSGEKYIGVLKIYPKKLSQT